MLRAWLPCATGAGLAVAAPLLAMAGAPVSLASAAGLAGLTLAIVAWPEPARRNDDPRSVASWADLQKALGLHGPAVAPDGRTFLAARPLAVPPLSDMRAVYDGHDGHAAGLAFWNPALGLLEGFLASDRTRLRSAAALEEDLGALARRHLDVRDVRVLPEPGGARVRYAAEGEAARPEVADLLRFLVPAAAARGARRVAFVTESRPGEVAFRWVDA